MVAKHLSALDAFLMREGFDGEARIAEPMARHTSFRIGGPARAYVRADSTGALMQLINAARESETPWRVIGRGTNLLVSDEGYNGMLIVLGRDFKGVRFDEEVGILSAGAAAALSNVVQMAFENSLSGLEFLVGTPGSVGGAVKMNAGTRDEWMSGRIRSVTSLSPDGTYVKRPVEAIEWGYRTSSFDSKEVILECELEAHKGNPMLIQSKMEGKLSRRRKTQPLSMPSCGSVFRNPEGMSVAKMIDDLGLKGTCVGGARISEVHANFIVNENDATASDVVALMDLVMSEVERAYGIELTPEVQLIGFDEKAESAFCSA